MVQQMLFDSTARERNQSSDSTNYPSFDQITITTLLKALVLIPLSFEK
jgi:hypothetical protein